MDALSASVQTTEGEECNRNQRENLALWHKVKIALRFIPTILLLLLSIPFFFFDDSSEEDE